MRMLTIFVDHLQLQSRYINHGICWLSIGALQVVFAAVDDVNTFADVVGKGMC